MKKFLALSLILGSFVFAVPQAEAATSVAAQSNNFQQDRYYRYPQSRREDRYDRNNRDTRYNRRGTRIETETRIVRIGRQRFRETYQIRYLPNGRTQTRLLSRVRIR